MLKLTTMLALSAASALSYMAGKYWAYDRCVESGWSETAKLLYIIIDSLKDWAVIFIALFYLLQ